MKVLVVEDEAISAMLIKQILRTMGHETVASTARGEEVIELVGAHDPHVVLMDIALAGEMTGIEAAFELRSVSDAGIVFTTGYATDEIRERALSVSGALFLNKPIVESELKAALDALPQQPQQNGTGANGET